jgi:hypothetical protein
MDDAKTRSAWIIGYPDESSADRYFGAAYGAPFVLPVVMK